MCVMEKDCSLSNTVNNINKEVKDLRKDFEGLSKLVYNHNDIISKIDVKVEDGVSRGVEKALKGLDDRINKNVIDTMEKKELEDFRKKKNRNNSFFEHGVKQAIGVIVAGVLAALVIVFQLVNNNDLKNNNSQLENKVNELTQIVGTQKEALNGYEQILEELRRELQNK